MCNRELKWYYYEWLERTMIGRPYDDSGKNDESDNNDDNIKR